MSKLKKIEERLDILEIDSHPPVDWELKIKKLEEMVEKLRQKLEKYGI